MQNRLYILTLLIFLVIRNLFFRFWSALPIFLIILFILFFIKNQHLTISLIQLEVLGLISLLLMFVRILVIEKELMALFIIIVVVVIEASVGLRLIVKQALNLNKEFFKFVF